MYYLKRLFYFYHQGIFSEGLLCASLVIGNVDLSGVMQIFVFISCSAF